MLTLPIIITLLLLLMLIILLLTVSGKKQTEPGTQQQIPDKPEKLCPLCGSPLNKHEKVYSDIIKGTSYDFMRIFGCPHCRSNKTGGQINRTCPVCKETLSAADYLMAEFYRQNKGRPHVSITGCSKCKTGF
jgi:predicted amidophosphoribosyltransferase